MAKNMPEMKETNLISKSRISILNALKMRERRLNMYLAQIEKSSEEQSLTKKYQEGLNTILVRIKKEMKEETIVEQRYINFVEQKLPSMERNFLNHFTF